VDANRGGEVPVADERDQRQKHGHGAQSDHPEECIWLFGAQGDVTRNSMLTATALARQRQLRSCGTGIRRGLEESFDRLHQLRAPLRGRGPDCWLWLKDRIDPRIDLPSSSVRLAVVLFQPCVESSVGLTQPIV
jgi:hypothetical protein